MAAPRPPASALIDLPGVGEKLAGRLAALGIERPDDLLFHLPRRYEDRTRVVPIGTVVPGAQVQVAGRIVAVRHLPGRRGSLCIEIADDTGRLTLRLFHFRPAQAARLQTGECVVCFGEARASQWGLELVHPDYRLLPAGAQVPVQARLTPVYATVEGLGQRRLRQLIEHRLDGPAPADLLGPLPALPTLTEALQAVHRPGPEAELASLLEGSAAPVQRLALEELVAHQLVVRQTRATAREAPAPILIDAAALTARLRGALGFALTGAQARVVAAVAADLAAARPMLRLVQGDVGAGKTAVAALAAAQAVGAGYQAAVMAPTELLAEQHLQAFTAWFAPLGVPVHWLAGGQQGAARRAAQAALADPAPAVVIGTHALFQEAVCFGRLGLAIIDEQHRFGVRQRLALRAKGPDGQTPHQLIMTATPIPRTLAMSAYADLDASVIDELPPGRLPVQTVAVPETRREAVIGRIRDVCAAGAQVYWVCTLIEENETLAAQAAEQTAARLQAALPELRVGLVHGRMSRSERDLPMGQFVAGQLQVLVATTVIEVGVNVPNASLMVIENAERLGLAQLHQLRGRVGRGQRASHCVLFYRPPLSPSAHARLAILRDTNDGFAIAERDLELRGPGELLGTRQTGLAQLRVAALPRDAHLLAQANALADRLASERPAAAADLITRWIGPSLRFMAA